MARHGSVRAPRGLRALLVTTALLAGACAHWGGGRARSDAKVRAAVEAVNAELARALVSGDAHALAAAFTADGELLSPAQPGAVSGRADLEAYYAARLGARRYVDAAITTLHLETSGDLAWEIGTTRVTVQAGGTVPVTVAGRYLAVWKREEDGSWRIRADLPVWDPVP